MINRTAIWLNTECYSSYCTMYMPSDSTCYRLQGICSINPRSNASDLITPFYMLSDVINSSTSYIICDQSIFRLHEVWLCTAPGCSVKKSACSKYVLYKSAARPATWRLPLHPLTVVVGSQAKPGHKNGEAGCTPSSRHFYLALTAPPCCPPCRSATMTSFPPSYATFFPYTVFAHWLRILKSIFFCSCLFDPTSWKIAGVAECPCPPAGGVVYPLGCIGPPHGKLWDAFMGFFALFQPAPQPSISPLLWRGCRITGSASFYLEKIWKKWLGVPRWREERLCIHRGFYIF